MYMRTQVTFYGGMCGAGGGGSGRVGRGYRLQGFVQCSCKRRKNVLLEHVYGLTADGTFM